MENIPNWHFMVFQDPFLRLPSEYQLKLTEEDKRGLRAFFGTTDIDTFSLELHEILLLKINNEQDGGYLSHWE